MMMLKKKKNNKNNVHTAWMYSMDNLSSGSAPVEKGETTQIWGHCKTTRHTEIYVSDRYYFY